METISIGIAGFGKMGRAIGKGIHAKKGELPLFVYDPALDPDQDRETFYSICNSLPELEEKADVVLLASKPGDLSTLCSQLNGKKKYISVAAGVAIDTLIDYFRGKSGVRMARVMPNISATIGQSVSGVYSPDPELQQLTMDLFSLVGVAVPVPREDLMHAVTGLAGSGPAFVFSFIHALAEGGLTAGLPFDRALELAAHTVKGAAELLLESKEHPQVLKNQVTSPGGTTIAGCRALENGSFHGTVMEAVLEAEKRSRELGKK